MDTTGLHSREGRAGYDRKVLRTSVIGVVGAGALGSNVVQTLGLSGVGELRIGDFDFIEPSNATRSPLFPKAATLGTKRRSKAKELAKGALELSYAEEPVVRYACSRVEALGLGALAGSDVIISAVDSFRARAWLSDAARLLGIPLVEGGFSGSRGQVSVYGNATADAPCYSCLNPTAEAGGISCTLYARGVLSEGGIPATQTIAALTAAYVAEAAIRLLHPDGSPLAEKLLTFDVKEGKGSLINLTTDPECPGVHRRIGEIRELTVRASEPVANIFEALPDIREPELILPADYLVEAPCARCGRRVHIGRPEWDVHEAPACSVCGVTGEESGSRKVGVVVASRVRPGDLLGKRSCRKVGIPPLGIAEVVDGTSGESTWIALDGSLDDLYAAKRGIPLRAEAMPDPVPAAARVDPGEPSADETAAVPE